MKKNKKLLIGIGIVALLGIVAVGVYQNRQQSEDGVVHIGAILPLTGSLAQTGNNMLMGMKVAAEELLNRGVRVRITVEDGKFSAKDTINAFNRIRTKGCDGYVVFGDVPSSSLLHVKQNDDMIPLFTLAAGAKSLISKNQTFWRGWPTTDMLGRKLSEFALVQLQKRDVAVLTIDNDYGNEFKESFLKHLIERGGTCLIDEVFAADQKSLDSQIFKILKTNPELIFLLGWGQGYTIAFNRLKELGYKHDIITGEAIGDEATNKNLYQNGKGAYFCDTHCEDGIEYQTFCNEYQKLAQKKPDVYGAYAYAILKLICENIVNSDDGNKFQADKMIDVDFDTILGRIHFTKDRELIVPVDVKQVGDNGTISVVK